MREIGIIDCIHRRWFPRKPPCEGSLGFNSIGLTEVRPALILLLFGFGAAIGALFLEIIYKAVQEKYHINIARTKRRVFRINTNLLD